MASKKEVFGVDVTGDITGLKKAMNDAERLMKSMERSLKNTTKAWELDPTNDDLLTKVKEEYRLLIEETKRTKNELKKDMADLVKNPNFVKGVSEYKEKFTTLELEIKKVTAREKELKKELRELPTSNVAKINEKFKQLDEILKKSKTSIETIKKSIDNVNKQIDLDPKNLDLYVQKNKLLNDELLATGKALRDLKKKEEDLNNTPGFLSSNFKSREHVQKLSDIRREIAELEKKYKELEERLRSTSPQMERFFKLCEKTSERFNEIARNTKYLSAAFASLGTAMGKSAIDYESSIANIRRVVKDLSEGTIQDLKDIATATGSAFADISDYASIGGALGLAEKDLAKFTQTMIDLNTATGGVFAGEEGAKGIAVFLKQLNLGIDQAENFGSAIAVIGDKYADIGDETVNVATRLTGLNAIIHTNQYELIGLAGVMADLGLATDSNANGINRAFLQIDKVIGGGVKNSSEKLEEMANVAGMTSKQFVEAWGSNAMDAFLRFTDGLKSSVFNDINNALATSSKEVQKYADVLGLSADQFERLWKSDSAKAFDMYVDALGELEDEGVVASKVLGDLGISSVNTAQTMLRLAGNGNEVRKAIELTEKAWNENTALTEKAGIIYETTAYKLKSMWESIKQLGGAIGEEMLPYIKDFADSASDLAKYFSKLSPTTKELIVKFVALGASISPVSKGIGLLTGALPKIIGFLSGTGGLIALVGALAVLLPTLGREHNLTEYFESMRAIKDETLSLNDALLENISNSDQVYRAKERELELYENEASAIDTLIHKLNDEKLSYEERKRVKAEIKQYIDDLNQALGTEAFKFDEVSGAIYENGKMCDSTKTKFQELTAEIKKETWLNAHKGVLEEAYSDLETSTDRMDQATQTYLQNADKIPENIRNMLEGFRGTFEEFKQILDENKIEYDEDQMVTWFQTWESYRSAIQETQTLIDNANSVIDNYMLVADANVETLDERINGATEAIRIMQDGVGEADITLDDLVTKRDTYKSTLTEEQAINDDLLTKYNEQIKSMEKQVAFEKQKEERSQKTRDIIKEYIRENDNWQPQDKHQYVYVHYVELGGSGGVGGAGSIGIRGGTGTRSGGFGSFGYGDLLKNTMASIRNSLGNYRSGGFASGGITVNANFTVNSNNVGRNEVRTWSSWIIDDLNEALGKQL